MEIDEKNWNAFNSSEYEPKCDTNSPEVNKISKHGAPWISLPNIAKPLLLSYCLFRLFFLFSPIGNFGVITTEVDNSLLTQLHHSIASLERVNKGSSKDLASLVQETWPHATYKQTLQGLCRTSDDTVVCYPGFNAFESFMGDIALQIADYNKMEDPSAFKFEFLDTLGKVNLDVERRGSKLTFNGRINRPDHLFTPFLHVIKALLLIELLILSFCLLYGTNKNLVWLSALSLFNGCGIVGAIVILEADWYHLDPFFVNWQAPPLLFCFVANVLILFGSNITVIVSASQKAEKKWGLLNRREARHRC